MTGMYDAVDLHHPDQIIHLGDYESDAERLADVYDDIPVCRVPGNCDGWGYTPLKKRITLAGKVFLLAHGHNWNVKSGYGMAIADAAVAGADVLLFGHTHIPYCTRTDSGLWVMNPGTSRTSYGLITIERGTISCEIHWN